VDISEYVVGQFILTSAVPPAFHHPSVVSKGLDMGSLWDRGGKSEDEE